MAQRHPQGGPEEWSRILRLLHREMQSLRRALARKEERIDSLEQFLLGKLQCLGPVNQGALNVPSLRPVRRRGPKNEKFLLEMAAQRGVEKLEIQTRPNGRASVHIEGGKPFHLPPILAQLLSILIQDTGCADGHLVGWKSLSVIQRHLEARTGRIFYKHNIEQHISRLRKALASEGGVNPRLIMSQPKLGWRFALRTTSRL